MNMDSINNHIRENLHEKRQEHIKRVTHVAVELANLYGVSEEKAQLAAYCHDIMRLKSSKDIDEYVLRFNLPKKYIGNPQLAHSKVGAEFIKQSFNVEDEDIIKAVAYHTTGRAKMSDLEKIVYLADNIEPGRNYENIHKLRQEAYMDLNKACLIALKNTMNFLENKGIPVDEDTIKAIEWLQSGGKYE